MLSSGVLTLPVDKEGKVVIAHWQSLGSSYFIMQLLQCCEKLELWTLFHAGRKDSVLQAEGPTGNSSPDFLRGEGK